MAANSMIKPVAISRRLQHALVTHIASSRHILKPQQMLCSGSRFASNKIASWPAPKQLSTPTDLTDVAVRQVSEELNVVIANAYAVFLKTKNFHWHLAGSHFRDYHLLFDEQADEILASIDPMAERIRRIGGTTLRSIGHIANLQTIKDNNDDFVDAQHMLIELAQDNKMMASMMRNCKETAEENRDHATSSLLEDLIDQTEKRTWFLHQSRLGGNTAPGA